MKHLGPVALIALAGCSSQHVAMAPAAAPVPAQVAAAPAPAGEVMLASEAEAALVRHDADAAIQLAELSVASAPDAAQPRETLARSYAAAGRYDAAVQSWDVILAANPEKPSAQLGRALALLAADNQSAALAALDQMKASGDVGLAYALAGDKRGLPMLEAAAQSSGASAKARQNLALGHALGGDWTGARAIASTDLPAEAIAARLSDWARIANAAPAVRVSMLLGVVQKVAAAPAPAVATAAAPNFVPPAVQAPRQIIIVPRAAPRPVAPSPKPMTIALETAPKARTGGWVVQLGAYPSAAEADGAWSKLSKLEPIHGLAPTRTNARGMLRVTVANYPERLTATRLCVKVKAAGADCFVRPDASGAKAA